MGNNFFGKGTAGRSSGFLLLCRENTVCVKHRFSSLFLLSKLFLSVLKMALVGLKAGITKAYQRKKIIFKSSALNLLELDFNISN